MNDLMDYVNGAIILWGVVTWFVLVSDHREEAERASSETGGDDSA